MMKFSVFIGVLFVQVFNFAASEALTKFQVVQTEHGPVKGIQQQTLFGRDYFSFQGIPYMKAPLGKLRFRSPEPPTPWKEPIDATKKSPAYTQIDTLHQKLVGQDDAGVVNVFTPSIDTSSALPVLVWIHGGSFYVSLEQRNLNLNLKNYR